MHATHRKMSALAGPLKAGWTHCGPFRENDYLSEIITHQPQLLKTFQRSWHAWQPCGSPLGASHMAISSLTKVSCSHTQKTVCGGWSGNTAALLQLEGPSPSGVGTLDNEPWPTVPISHFSKSVSHLLPQDSGDWHGASNACCGHLGN